MRRAVASLVSRGPEYLVVWSQRFQNWSLPGGKLEAGETLFDGNARELREETGLVALRQKLVYQAFTSPETGVRGESVQVSVMEVVAEGEPFEAEKGSPVTWLTRDELVAQSPYREFYACMFATLEGKS